MWDNARLLNTAADALFLVAAAIALWLAAQCVMRSAALPVRTVAIVGEASRVDAESVSAQLEGRIAGNLFAVDLEDVRRRVESVQWVRRAAVRREWPDRLVVEVQQHRPLARWSERWLVNTYGELFEAEIDAVLPRLGGPPGTEREVTRRYLAFREVIAPLGTEPVQVIQSARFAWQVKLANGMVLELGRDDARESTEARLARFVSAFPRVVGQLNRRLDHIDLRYPNGFAIRVPESGATPQTTESPTKGIRHARATNRAA